MKTPEYPPELPGPAVLARLASWIAEWRADPALCLWEVFGVEPDEWQREMLEEEE